MNKQMDSLVTDQIAEATRKFDEAKYADIMKTDGTVVDKSLLTDECDAVLLHATRMYTALRDFIEKVILHKKFFPNCAASMAYLNTKMIVAKNGSEDGFRAYCYGLTDEFVEVFKNVSDSVIKKRDLRVLDVLDAVPALHVFGFKAKFEQLSRQAKRAAGQKLEILWGWLEKFKEISEAYNVYTTLPKSVYTAVRAKTSELQKKFADTGELSGADMNIFDIGTSVLGMSGSGDKSEFETLLESGKLNIAGVAKLVQLELKANGVSIADVLSEGLKATTGAAPTATTVADAAAAASARVTSAAPASLDLGVLGKK